MARSSSGQRASALLAILVSLVGASSAAAAEGEEGAGGIVYEAPPECPSKSELLAAIEARATPSHEVDRRTFHVSIERTRDGAFEGRLEVVGGSHVPRVTRAAECVAVMRTLALFVVIARTPETTSPAAPPPPVEAAPRGHVPSPPAQ